MTPSASDVLAHLDPEVWLVTARHGPRRGGLIATSVTSLSIVPELPRLLLGVASDHFTAELIEAAGAFVLHLLNEARLDWIWRFGLQSGRQTDKLQGLTFSDGQTGGPILAGTIGWLECQVESRTSIGDRTLYVGEVVAGALELKEPALRWQRVLALATPDQRAQLKAQRELQASRDAELIRAWRQEHCG